MHRIKAAASVAILSAGLLAATAAPASAETCSGTFIVNADPVLIETATGDCRFMEGGSSVYPSNNGSALINLLTLPIGVNKWIQINVRDFSGLSLLFVEGKGTNTWYK